ncbi:hypothetical protein V8D89_005132 [Ganoderma adspersum]
MSTAAAQSSSSSSSGSSVSSSASSFSSAPSSWSPFLAHPRLCNMDPSANTSSSRVPSSSPASASIAAFPSLAHSLSAFPNMTFVTNDMVHYGTLGRTKGASQAKLNSALRITKQRQVSTAPPAALAMVSVRCVPAARCGVACSQPTTPPFPSASSHAQMSAPASSSQSPQTCTRYPTPDDEDPVLLLVPKRSKAKRSS